MSKSTMFKNVIPGRKAKSGQFIYNYYSKRFKFNPEDYPKLTSIAQFSTGKLKSFLIFLLVVSSCDC